MNLDATIADTLPTAETRGGCSLQRFVRGHLSATLINGDCLDALPIVADAVVSDPPYGVAWDTNYNFGLKNSSAPYAKNLVRKKHTLIKGDDKPFDPTPWLSYPIVVLWGANNFSDRLPQGSWLV